MTSNAQLQTIHAPANWRLDHVCGWQVSPHQRHALPLNDNPTPDGCVSSCLACSVLARP